MTTASASTTPTAATAAPRAGALLAALLTPATMLALLGLGLVVLLTPPWIHAAIGWSGASLPGAASVDVLALSDRTVAELLMGPGTFSFAGPTGASLYTPSEAAHLRDVRVVLFAFLGLALGAGLLVALSLARGRRDPALWRAAARGGAALAATLVLLGLFAALAFGVAFELFHRILFPGGNWAFPESSNLIRLYPLGFWQLSAAALGILGVAGGALTWLVARRRAAALGGR